jgi:hypothetical protein
VQPFWGDSETCEIGINRLDVNLNYNIAPSAIFIGNIFGDSEKNSINKKCKPRNGIGNLCDQVTSQGTINMIRETIDGNIEDYDIEGGRVIDDNGNWAYQIPMNLDYVITNEFGDLIPSDNPNIGIPTRANVRFKVGMDETGGEGRLRTRAKFLIPNNPNNSSEIDYEFGPKTKKGSLRSLYWNKIYSISSFIPRFQTNRSNNRAFTGIKDEYARIYKGRLHPTLQDLFGLSASNYATISSNKPVKCLFDGCEYDANMFSDIVDIKADNVTTEGAYKDVYYSENPIIVRRNVCNGTALYITSFMDIEFYTDLLKKIFNDVNIISPFSNFSDQVEICTQIGEGAKLVFLVNHSGDVQTIGFDDEWVDIYNTINGSGDITIAPYNSVVLEFNV